MALINWLFRNAYMPACRSYARRFVKDKPADGVMQCLAGFHFWKVHGYWPHLQRPRSFEEKINARMLFDRDPKWTLLSDKLLVRDYVAGKAGSDCLIPLLWSGTDPEAIPFEQLPAQFVIKANHGCGYNLIVTDKTKLDRAKAQAQLRKWLGENYCRDKFLGLEWAYAHIVPRLLVEAFIGDRGKVPQDCKVFCFAGKAEYVEIIFDRFDDPSEKFFDRDFTPLDLWQGIKQYRHEVPRPKNYDRMIAVAESLAQGLDFVRVDLYNIAGKIWFGELTCYPSRGCTPFVPESYDFLWGEKWKFNPRSA